MMLRDLTGDAAVPPGIDVKGLSADSRQIMPGYLFAALAGTKVEGRSFIADALARGAVAVLGDPVIAGDVPARAVFVRSDNPRRRLAELAARFYAGQPEAIAAVTGTNGKTSVAAFTRQIWMALGYRAASLGTLGVVGPDGTVPLGHTTPDPVLLHRVLATLKDSGVEHLALEASSHGLAQFRVDGVRLKAAGFTNLTRDHMDYHPTFEDYRAAKIRLFADVLPRGGLAVINRDGAHADAFEAVSRGMGHRVVTVGAAGDDLKLLAQRPHLRGQDLRLLHAGRVFEVPLPLPGLFQAGNALVAAAFAIGLGGDAEKVFAALAGLQGAPGRLELAGVTAAGAPVFIDYAHTPDAIETVLKSLRPHTERRLHIVFGCGGDRDPGKRPMMGRAAALLADAVVVTDDNPRSEDPALIRAAVLAGAPSAREIADRARAIHAVIEELRAGDVLVIAGKGHETGQIIGREILPFNDLEEARAALRARGGQA